VSMGNSLCKTSVPLTIAAAMAVSACGMPMPGSHFQSAVLPRAGRELSDVEKASLARSMPVNFRNPDSAKFRWLPLAYEPGSTQVEYCGLINTKSSSGAYSGYRAFHAVLLADPRGQFTNGIIDHPKSGTDLAASAGGDVAADGATEDLCRRAGYPDFSQAK
jgi:hypothetical protein